MKGKKIDTEFISNFIEQCIKCGLFSTAEMLSAANDKIEYIDFQIKEVEKLKIIRSKLLDVVSTFDKSVKDKSSEKKVLEFLNISHPHIAKIICDMLCELPISIQNIKMHEQYCDDMIFCIKQLQDNNIVSRVGDSLIRGELFTQYYDYLNQDYKKNER